MAMSLLTNLHSNMFLLIPGKAAEETAGVINLHSNMFLLIRVDCLCIVCGVDRIYIPICFY